MFEVNYQWLSRNAKQTPYGLVFTKDQIRILGQSYPLSKGWIDGVIGMELDDCERQRFEMRITRKQLMHGIR